MIDWSRVEELRDEIGAEDFAEVVEIFLEEVEEVIAVIPGGVADDTIEAHLQFLKGSALNLGFQAFSGLCQSGETAAAAGDYAAIDLNAVVAIYQESKAVFLAQLDEKFAA
ncbi:Hpt domain-containing protein [Roseovarius faecimaris]|uniref:Hpt domain-containing protein n=1 Tax=Roseovarius faecimaris TaxID=2494550 RepID=A0A6I6ITQ4_9RHOB|nr:Hpt domain-containing protein [Roseovarius faecimaris]QGY00126.1 Hpt domain-containing protein [Roseovarius faecimaris]